MLINQQTIEKLVKKKESIEKISLLSYSSCIVGQPNYRLGEVSCCGSIPAIRWKRLMELDCQHCAAPNELR